MRLEFAARSLTQSRAHTKHEAPDAKRLGAGLRQFQQQPVRHLQVGCGETLGEAAVYRTQ
jgi:hypothetical protein